MAKIENTIVYPTVTPAASDLLIATDVSNNNKTVTFLVSSISGGGVLQDLQSVLDTGNTAIQEINLTGDINVIGTVYPSTITASGTIGTAGQILSSTGSGIQWIDPSAIKACCSWNDTLSVGNFATQDALVQSAEFKVEGAGGTLRVDNPATVKVSGQSFFSNTVFLDAATELNFALTAQINDSASSTGTAGQWLTSLGPGLGVQWSSTLPPGGSNTLQQVLNAGNTSLNKGMTFTGTSIISLSSGVSILSSGNNVWGGTNTFSNNGNTATTAGIALSGTLWDGTSIGTAGQVLSSTGSGVAWITPAAGGGNNLQQVLDLGNVATGVNANITISGALTTGTIIDSSGSPGSVGQYLSINGSGLSWVNNACCNLQDVLNVGATASTSIVLSGAGISLTVPTVIPAFIQDGGGQVGLANQVLTMNSLGTELEWNNAPASGVSSITSNTTNVSSTGNAITQNTLATGAVTLNVFEYDGDTNVGYVPRGGNNDPLLFLNGTGNWTTAGGGAGVTSVNATLGSSAGTPLTIAPSTGAVLIQSNSFQGSSNVGHVPDSSAFVQNTNFLRADGTWAVPTFGAPVTSVSLGAGAVSVGSPLVITPTTGAVVINPRIYNGAGNVGFVPTGGTNTTFLRGDGTWQPAGGGGVTTNTHNVFHKFNNPNIGTAVNEYFAMPGATQAAIAGDVFQNVSINPPSVWNGDLLMGASFYSVPAASCDITKSQYCSANLQMATTMPGKYTTQIWKYGNCKSGAPVLIAECVNTLVGPLPIGFATTYCCDFTTMADPSDLIIDPGFSLLVTQIYDFKLIGTLLGKLSVRLSDLN